MTNRILCLSLGLFMSLIAPPFAHAFSPLGPYDYWMQPVNGFQQPGDIGGPMNIGPIDGEEYRWNVPVLTYAFDQSFLDYFGPGGVAAVEKAIGVLNELPPATTLNPSNFPPNVTQVNFLAQSQNLLDLKSQTLSLLLEQLGLASPTRYAYCVRDILLSGTNVTDVLVVQRNFDPVRFIFTNVVNDTALSYKISNFDPEHGYWDAVEFPLDPLQPIPAAVADGLPGPGTFFTGLTRDDAGGLCYLLRTTNVNVEMLLPNVYGAGPNAGSYANQASRLGVDKLTFVHTPFDSLLGHFFTPFTNQFTDRYVTNFTVHEQLLERVVQQPDFLFSSADLTKTGTATPLFIRTGTSNWLSGGPVPGFIGPGIIRPPVQITFGRPGPEVQTRDNWPEGTATVTDVRWGSFDGSTNSPVAYPAGSEPSSNLTIHLQIHADGSSPESFTWQLPIAPGLAASLQTSTNLTNWTELTTVINRGAPVVWNHHRSRSQRFFRVVPD